MRLPKNPTLLEINTWTWLQALSRDYGRPVTLNDVPAVELDEIARFDAVWLMGVWERSPEGRRVALRDPALQREFRRALPDFAPEDVVGSPYSVRRYRVDERLGGPRGLAHLRTELAARDVSLILDFVPNHLALDHDWTTQRPHYFIQGSVEDSATQPSHFFTVAGHVYAHGRDPHFAPWSDTAQINAFHPEVRRELTGIVSSLAEQCDGLRCDMAMLLTNEVFSGTWGDRAGAPPSQEFWPPLISAIRDDYPDFVFVAEVYWDMEWQLQQQGFDYCYDKRFYDRLAHADAESIRAHLTADLSYQEKLLRFIENHDEPRVPSVFGDRWAGAAILSLTVPGAKLVHQGQMKSHRVRLPVQLARRPVEQDDAATAALYERLVRFASRVHRARWRLIETPPHWIAHVWEADPGPFLIMVNWSERPTRGRIPLGGISFQGNWRFQDFLTDRSRDYESGELDARGVEVDQQSWNGHVFQCTRL